MKLRCLLLVISTFLSSFLLFGCSPSPTEMDSSSEEPDSSQEHSKDTGNKTDSTAGEMDSNHEHTEGVSIEMVSPKSGQTSLETEMTVVIMDGGQPLTEAEVGFEFWKEGETKHHFIDAAESKEGHYQAALSFQQAGEYTVKVHVEKGELHEHKDLFLTVE